MAWILEYMPRQEKTHTLHTHIVIFMLDVFVRFRVLYCLHNFLACFSIIRFATLYCFSSGENIYINSHKLLELLVKKGNRSFSTKANTQTNKFKDSDSSAVSPSLFTSSLSFAFLRSISLSSYFAYPPLSRFLGIASAKTRRRRYIIRGAKTLSLVLSFQNERYLYAQYDYIQYLPARIERCGGREQRQCDFLSEFSIHLQKSIWNILYHVISTYRTMVS